MSYLESARGYISRGNPDGITEVRIAASIRGVIHQSGHTKVMWRYLGTHSGRLVIEDSSDDNSKVPGSLLRTSIWLFSMLGRMSNGEMGISCFCLFIFIVDYCASSFMASTGHCSPKDGFGPGALRLGTRPATSGRLTFESQLASASVCPPSSRNLSSCRL